MGASMSLACTADKNWDTLNYERYLTIALAIGNDNPYSFACFSALNEAQQNLLISQTIAAGLQSAPTGTIERGQVSNTTGGTASVTQGVYSATTVVGTLDAGVTTGMGLATTNNFGLKNTSGTTRIFRFYGSVDAKGANPNHVLGIRLAKNGTSIPETECRAYASSNAEAKLVTSWMIELADQDEVNIHMTSYNASETITIARGRLVASTVD
jgi:hypothetical protein